MDVRPNSATGTDSAVERQVSTDSALSAMETATCHASICSMANSKTSWTWGDSNRHWRSASTRWFDLHESV